MARKYDFISELYNRTCKMVVANPESWEAFLRSACYNYRLRFDEQLLVHAQRPDATAVLQIDDWNQKFGRWVNRGAHGIAVFEDADQRRQRLVHYFDISDTHPSRFSRRVPIWQMRDEYTAEVIDTLESTFGELDDKETLAAAIESAARNAVEDNIPDYLSDLIYSVKDSFLDGVSEEEITHIFKTAVRNSVAYMTMTRLGIEAGEYFEPDDLRDVVNFTTPATLNALGYATSDIAEMGLAEISRTILALDRQNRIIAEKTKADYNVGKEKTERSPDDERDHLHEAGGLSAPRSDNAGAARAVDGQVRPDAEEVPEGASQGTLLQPADELRPERASERHGAQSERDGTDADGADGSVGGRDGESESDGYDELGSEDEQYPEPGSGDRDGGGILTQKDKAGMPTRYNLARAALDEAIAMSHNLRQLEYHLSEMGYTLGSNPKRKYWTIRGKGDERPIRLHRLGEEYTKVRITQRLIENRDNIDFEPFQPKTYRPKQYRLRTRSDRIGKVGGLYGLYLYYCYRLGYLPKYKAGQQNQARVHYLFKEDLIKIDELTKQVTLLGKHHIGTDEQLFSYQHSVEEQIKTLTADRTHLRNEIRKVNITDAELSQAKASISLLGEKLKELRKEVKLCQDIAVRSKVIEEKVGAVRAEEEKSKRKENRNYEQRR